MFGFITSYIRVFVVVCNIVVNFSLSFKILILIGFFLPSKLVLETNNQYHYANKIHIRLQQALRCSSSVIFFSSNLFFFIFFCIYFQRLVLQGSCKNCTWLWLKPCLFIYLLANHTTQSVSKKSHEH